MTPMHVCAWPWVPISLSAAEPLSWSDQWHPVATLMLDEHDWHSMPGAKICRNAKNEMIIMKIINFKNSDNGLYNDDNDLYNDNDDTT